MSIRRDLHAPTTAKPLCWLHLSDLHVGGRGETAWWSMLDQFWRSIDTYLQIVGAPDLILLTGDLTARGTRDQFDMLTKFLERLLTRLPPAADGFPPLVVPVPGNHDVLRPSGREALPYRVLRDYEKGADDPDVAVLLDEFWGPARDASFVRPLFAGYLAWFDEFIRPQAVRPEVTLIPSFFPGDVYVSIDPPDRFPLAVVGLNSAWLQYQSGDFEGKLALPVEQFHAALPARSGESPLKALEAAHRALLLMHHPHQWLSRPQRQLFESEIHCSDRFVACLHGHMHEPAAVNTSRAGGVARCYYQAPSLFGVDEYGSARERRLMGYTWAALREDGELRVWPLRFQPKGSGSEEFDRDNYFHWDPVAGNVLLRPADGRHHGSTRVGADSGRARAPKLARATELDLTAYCRDVLRQASWISFDGFAVSPELLRRPIESLYTRLRTYDLPGTPEDSGVRSPPHLADLLPYHQRLLIEGQPGSGKTTFLKLVATALARDFMGEPGPDGVSWRAAHLCGRMRATLPVFIKVSTLAERAAAASLDVRGDDLLLDHLVAATVAPPSELSRIVHAHRVAWHDILSAGGVTLLFDGFDEVGDSALRDRVFAAFEALLSTWPTCQVVVSSRPIAVERLKELGFVRTSVAELDDKQIRDYVTRWVGALAEIIPERLMGATEAAYADAIVQAIRARGELRRLALSPMMLTCLCMVYSHGGLPEGRAELYRHTIRWLVAARQMVRKQRGYGGVHVQEAFSALALAMMGDLDAPKRREIGFKEAATIVDSIVQGPAFNTSPAARVSALCEWLRFECEYSGVIEEIGRGQLQFRHLTFQEYLAAAQLTLCKRAEWWPIIRARLNDIQWRETIDLFPACLLDSTRGAKPDITYLFQQVHELWSERPPIVRAALVTAITGRFRPALRAARYELPADLAAVDQRLRAEAEAVFTREGAAKLEAQARIDAAEAIGVAGDRRLAPERREKNLRGVPGTNIRLGRYLVTVEEFSRFVEDQGYQRPEFWTDAGGWSFCRRELWTTPGAWDSQLRFPNRPVVRVSWFEAMAYCRWLGAELHLKQIRLPTIAEWSAAVPPCESSDASTTEPVAISLCPVGIFADRDGPYGHSDLGNSVWQWTYSIADDADPTEGDMINKWGQRRAVVIGVGMNDEIRPLREWYWSDDREGDVGFRIVSPDEAI